MQGAGTTPTLLSSDGELLLVDLLNTTQGQGSKHDCTLDVNKTVLSAVTNLETYLHLAASKGEADYNDIVDFIQGDPGRVSVSQSALSTGIDIELVALTVKSKHTETVDGSNNGTPSSSWHVGIC